jgi:phosphoglycerate kinase
MAQIDNFDFKGKKVLIRVDFNVPLNDKGEVSDAGRIKAAVPTIKKITGVGGKVILMSHLGRPKGEKEDKFSLSQIVSAIEKELGLEVDFVDDCIGKEVAAKVDDMEKGEVLLLENLRFYPEETSGDKAFAKALAELGEVYVNDAFGTAHRAHASTAVIAEFFQDDNKMFGYLIEQELEAVSKLLEKPKKPFTAIMGGAKISDKILLIEEVLDKVDHLIIGGGMSYTFFKAQGGQIGNSLVEADKLDLCKELLQKAKAKGVELHLPQDSVVADKFDNEAHTQVADNHNIADGYMGLDIGPEAVEKFSEVIRQSKTILWNGPMGVFEMDNFSKGTKKVAEAVADATSKGAYSLIGGGDSAAAIKKFGLEDKVSYISTGGGALLEFLEGKELPGIKAIKG